MVSDRCRVLPALLLVLLALGGCASGGSSGDGGSARSRTGDITRQDMDAQIFDSAWDAVRRLRPRWLQRRGGAPLPMVFLDGVQQGEAARLRDIPAQNVSTIRFISAADATTRYGTGFPGGIIEVLSRRGR